MRVRLDAVAPLGLLIVPVAALLWFGLSAGPPPSAVSESEVRDVRPLRRPPRSEPASVPSPRPARSARSPRPTPRATSERSPVARFQPGGGRRVVRTPPPPAGEVALPERSDGPAQGQHARQLLAEKKYAEAILTAKGCLAQHPDDSSCRSTLLSSYLQTHAYREATKEIDSCLEADPSDPTCLLYKTNLLVARANRKKERSAAPSN